LFEDTMKTTLLILMAMLAGCQAGTRVSAPESRLQRSIEAPGATWKMELKIRPGRRERPEAAPSEQDRWNAEATERGVVEAAWRGERAGEWEEDTTKPRRPQVRASGSLGVRGGGPQADASGLLGEGEDSHQQIDDGDWASVIEEAVRHGAEVDLSLSGTVPNSADTQSLEAVGPGLHINGDGKLEFIPSVPELAFADGDGGGGGSGSVSSGFTATIAGRTINALHILGGLMLVAAVVPIVIRPRRIGLAGAMAGSGLAIIAAGTVAETYPWILAVGFVVFLGVLVWLAVDAWRARKRSQELKETVFAIDAAKVVDPDFARAIDKNRGVIRAAMGDRTARSVDKLRR